MVIKALRSAPAAAAFAALLALPLAGCLSLGGKVPEQMLTLTPARTAPAGFATTGPANSALAVTEPSTSQRLNVNRVPVQTSDSSLAYLQDAVWVEKPTRLFQTLLTETIRAGGNRLVIREGDLGQSGLTTLSGQLLDMGYDAAAGAVVVRYDGVLQTGDGQVRTRRFESRVPAAPDAVSVAPALNQAANQVAQEVADWVG
jgi:cholesterol transport system auxiliary component